MSVTVVSPINIAFIKYWGKVDQQLIIPTNDSFSITLSTNQFRTKTSVVAGVFEDGKDRLWLNGEEEDLSKSGRLSNVLAAVRASLPEEQRKLNVRIVSENNFPTAAGMASSAAGLSALAYALAKYFNSPVDVSVLARIGSGSACRSVLGGFVKWVTGVQEDGSDCKAVQHVDETYWPDMQVMCLVTEAAKKAISSTKGMQYAVENSPLMEGRVKKRVPERMAAVSEAVKNRDFAAFAELTMADCEDFRAVCRSSTPCVDYWTDLTEEIVALVKAFNAHAGRTVAAYTYDAGANAFIFTEKATLPTLMAYFMHHLQVDPSKLFLEDTTLLAASREVALDDALKNALPPAERPLKFILHSTVGAGPSVRPAEESLVTDAGLPK